LAFGNTVVLKPADLTPGCAHVLAEILVGCGVPPGVFNLVMGSGSRLGAALTAHPDVAAISFTGSRATGDRVLDSARLTLKKVQLEMGGKNPTVVMDDADLDLAVPAVIDAAFHSTGQRCTATSRIVVHRKVHDAFVERLVHAMDALRVGDALDPLTRIGPVVSAAQLDSNLRYVAMAAADGAEVQGGQPVGGKGHFQRPGLFLGARNDMRTSREEIFGPLASVIRVEDFDEALATANDTPFGLAAGIFTTSLRHWRAFRRGARAGVVTVNLATAGLDYHVPFGGTRGSSFGPREQGRHAVEFYTSIKTVYTLAG
jgi:aldehyde dehydrogenase (NAD+)